MLCLPRGAPAAVAVSVIAFAALANAAKPPATTDKPGASAWKPGAMGVLRIVKVDGKGYDVEVVLPAQEMNEAPLEGASVSSPGTLEIFDDKGRVGTVDVGEMRNVMWCENDGGNQVRATWTGRIARESLKRALVANGALQDFAAFVRAPGKGGAPMKPAKLTYKDERVAYRSRALKASIITAPDEAKNCDGAPSNNLTITLRSERGDVALRCCGP